MKTAMAITMVLLKGMRYGVGNAINEASRSMASAPATRQAEHYSQSAYRKAYRAH